MIADKVFVSGSKGLKLKVGRSEVLLDPAGDIVIKSDRVQFVSKDANLYGQQFAGG
jgi:hypothetical protein